MPWGKKRPTATSFWDGKKINSELACEWRLHLTVVNNVRSALSSLQRQICRINPSRCYSEQKITCSWQRQVSNYRNENGKTARSRIQSFLLGPSEIVSCAESFGFGQPSSPFLRIVFYCPNFWTQTLSHCVATDFWPLFLSKTKKGGKKKKKKKKSAEKFSLRTDRPNGNRPIRFEKGILPIKKNNKKKNFLFL